MPENLLPATAAILAGGASRRMGQNKALLSLDGQPLIAHVANKLAQLTKERIIISNDVALYSFLGLPIYKDLFVGAGALAGVHAALTYATQPWVFIVACDMPLLNITLLRWLFRQRQEVDVVMPKRDGREEPLHALYQRRVLPAVEARLQAGQRRVTSFLPDVKVRFVEEAAMRPLDPDLRSFSNANTPAEWQQVLAIWAQK